MSLAHAVKVTLRLFCAAGNLTSAWFSTVTLKERNICKNRCRASVSPNYLWRWTYLAEPLALNDAFAAFDLAEATLVLCGRPAWSCQSVFRIHDCFVFFCKSNCENDFCFLLQKLFWCLKPRREQSNECYLRLIEGAGASNLNVLGYGRED